MYHKLFVFLCCFVLALIRLPAQQLQLFNLMYYEIDTSHSLAFVSLSEIYQTNEHPDSSAIPDLSDFESTQAHDFKCFTLDSCFRKRFLKGTGLTETDKVFVYDYAKDKLQSFAIRQLKVVACMSIYCGEWPYTQNDYMIGFEIDKNLLKDFDKYYEHVLVTVGKENSFVRGKMKAVKWTQTPSADFPILEPPQYDSLYAGLCKAGDTYKFEADGLQYFMQHLVNKDGDYLAVKRIVVLDSKTKSRITEKYFYTGESAEFAPMDYQWTGMLFKDKPAVICGFHFVSFDCPHITFLDQEMYDIIINCDNRH